MPLSQAERSRSYRERHPERARAAGRAHYRRNSERCREAQRRYYYENQEAQQEAARTYWDKHPEKRKANNRRALEVRKEMVRAAKDKPCADCGIRYPIGVMDFDHPPGTREIPRGVSVSTWGMSVGVERFAAEIAKCEVRCANCHRMKHLHPEEAT